MVRGVSFSAIGMRRPESGLRRQRAPSLVQDGGVVVRCARYAERQTTGVASGPLHRSPRITTTHSEMPTKHPLFFISLPLLLCHAVYAGGQSSLQNSVHRTPAAERVVNDLWCYRCHTMDANDKCNTPHANHTTITFKCKNDNRICMVKKFSYTTSTENSTSHEKMWALERNCTKHCEPGCIVIGERTKLYACTSCCTTSFCNNGTGGASNNNKHFMSVFTLVMLSLVCIASSYFPDFPGRSL